LSDFKIQKLTGNMHPHVHSLVTAVLVTIITVSDMYTIWPT